MKKYELTAEKKINWLGRELFQIRALISFETITGEEVKAGDLGGYVESENNLSHEEKAWLSGNAEVWGNAKLPMEPLLSSMNTSSVNPFFISVSSLSFIAT